MGSKKTKSTQVSTPNVPDWIQKPQQQFADKLGGLMSEGGWASANTPATAQQTKAWSYGGSPIDQGLMNFNPGTIAGSNLSAYTNPWETSVVNSSLADNERARQMAIQGGQAQATAAGAFGGSRHGVADSLTNEDYLRNAGSLASQLRMAGYSNAQDMAQRDIGNRLSGAQFRLGAQGVNADNARADASLMASLGEQQRQYDARSNPNSIESLQALSSLMQYNPAMYVGNTTNTTQRTSGGGLSGVLGGAGSLFGGLGALGWKPLGS